MPMSVSIPQLSHNLDTLPDTSMTRTEPENNGDTREQSEALPIHPPLNNMT